MKGVLLLHGFLTGPDDFAPIMDKMHEMYDYVECPLYPGHVDNTEKFTWEGTFRVVNEAYTGLAAKCDVIDVIGFSMGGTLAAYIASNYAVRNLVLLAPANKFLNPAFPFSLWIFYFKSKRIKHKLMKQGNFYDLEKEFDERIRAVKVTNHAALDMGKTRLVPRWTPTNLYNFHKVISRCNRETKKITSPTLIIWGRLDQLVTKKSPIELYNKVNNPDKFMFFFDDISHMMLYSVNNDRIINAVVSFLKNNDA